MGEESTANDNQTGADCRAGRAVARQLWAKALAGAIQVYAAPGDFELRLVALHHAPYTVPSTLDGASLEQVVFGRLQKALAIDSERSPAAISGDLRRHLEALGLHTSSRRLPLALAVLAHAATAELVDVALRSSGAQGHSWGLVARISEASLARLTSAERDVALRYLGGQSHLQIASARGSSPRTVANQLGAVFQRFSSAGRFGLLGALIAEGLRAGQRASLWIDCPAAEVARAS